MYGRSLRYAACNGNKEHTQMSLASGDLTTPARFGIWYPGLSSPNIPIVAQLISSVSAMIYSRLNRARLYSQTFSRTFDGVGTYQIVLPDYPVTSIASVQRGAQLIQPYLLPSPVTGLPIPTFGYGYRIVLWEGNLPGQPAIIELVNGGFGYTPQNIKVVYQAGYVELNEAQTVPNSSPHEITVLQPQGVWCRDNGVVYAATGVALTAVASNPTQGQYVAPSDASPGLYVFSSSDSNSAVLISYSFIPADLEEACIQMVAERYSYRSRIGELDKVLGGQETIRYLRGGGPRSAFHDLPPEVEGLIWPYVSVVPPAIGAPV